MRSWALSSPHRRQVLLHLDDRQLHRPRRNSYPMVHRSHLLPRRRSRRQPYRPPQLPHLPHHLPRRGPHLLRQPPATGTTQITNSTTPASAQPSSTSTPPLNPPGTAPRLTSSTPSLPPARSAHPQAASGTRTLSIQTKCGLTGCTWPRRFTPPTQRSSNQGIPPHGTTSCFSLSSSRRIAVIRRRVCSDIGMTSRSELCGRIKRRVQVRMCGFARRGGI